MKGRAVPKDVVARAKAAMGAGITAKAVAHALGLHHNTMHGWKWRRPDIDPEPGFSERLAVLIRGDL